MPKAQTCYFSLTYGLQGCYMPDSHWGAHAISRRKDLIAIVRDTLEMLDAPKRAIHQVDWRKLWASAKRHGTSSVHFCIATDKHNMLEFHGMTEAEYLEVEKENE